MKQTEGRTTMKFDPQLHALRSIAGSIENRIQKQQTQSARFNLFEALSNNDIEGAKNWLNALEAALACATLPNLEMRQAAAAAILSIRGGIQ